ncbi:MAG: DNA methylase [Gammaproteobacteria bacterium]|nr:DNA methylase [Gammaproteobacteria bacterium]MCY4026414.1 DNA methylase [Acidobacteriota bacterium]
MRHRFHSICPYFAMFPETFVEKHLTATRHAGVVFDPYCGRGTTVFQALLQGRTAAGSDLNPVAVCVSGAKGDPPSLAIARARLDELRHSCGDPNDEGWQGELDRFFDLCFHQDTMLQVRYLRSVLDWRNRKDDRFIAALCLGALHGESHKSPNCFSNRMPRTISTKPDYSVRWWTDRSYAPPSRDVFEILERMLEYRFRTRPPDGCARVVQADSRRVAAAFPALAGRVTDVITSPPYLDTTNYREDQWLRLWFLGGQPIVPRGRRDDRHYNKDVYWSFIQASMKGLAPLLAKRARLVIRIGGRRLRKTELKEGLLQALTRGLDRDVEIIDDGVTTEVGRTQANVFRGQKVSRVQEHDFCFAM